MSDRRPCARCQHGYTAHGRKPGLLGCDMPDCSCWGYVDPDVSVHAAPEFNFGPVRKPERIGIGYLAAPIVGQAADAWTTYEGLKRGFRESNPFMAPLTKRPMLFALGKVGAGFAFAFWAKKLADKGHARAGKGLAVAAGFLGVVPAAFNVTTMRRGR